MALPQDIRPINNDWRLHYPLVRGPWIETKPGMAWTKSCGSAKSPAAGRCC